MYLNDHIIYFVNHRLNSVGCNRESARRIFREYVQTEQNFMELTRYFDVPTPSIREVLNDTPPPIRERWILATTHLCVAHGRYSKDLWTGLTNRRCASRPVHIYRLHGICSIVSIVEHCGLATFTH